MVDTLEPRTYLAGTCADTFEADAADAPPQFDSIPSIDPNQFTFDAPVAERGPFPDSQTFLLHSRPTATKVIYLDFDGFVTTGTAWNTGFNMATITTPVFDLDGNASSFSSAELTMIQQDWQRVAEAFSPFDVDVTTEDPGIEALRNSGNGDQNWGIRVAIGGDCTGVLGITGAGGIAYIGSFSWDSDTPCFVFPNSLGQSEKPIADATVHEVGHTLGLSHDGLSSPPTAYYSGHGTGPTGWAPIMGVGYSQQLVQWSKGEYPNANNQEDDLNTITTQNGFNYRPDDYGNSQAAAQNLTSNSSGDITASGVIERNTDTDWFRFLSTGPINIQINPAVRGAMLDIQADLYDSAGALVVSSNPTAAINATITTNVTPGFYYLKIDGVGKAANGSDFGYSDYSSIGQYTITGNVGNNFPPVINDQSFNIAETAAVGALVGNVVASDQDVGQALTYAITAGNTNNTFSINPTTGALTLAAKVDYETLSTYQLTVQVTDPGGLTDTGIVTVKVTDVNEPPVIVAQTFSVNEKSPSGSVVGAIVATDPDLNQSKTFAIVSGNTNGAFNLDSSTGQLTVSNPSAIDFNNIQSFTLTVSVTDSGSPPLAASAPITVNLKQVNVAPVVTPNAFTLAENSAKGTVLGQIAATDGNANQSLSFSITNGNVGGAFQIDPTTGVLTVNNSAAVNFEVTPQFLLQVTATDNGVPPLSGSATITVNLTNVNDPPILTPQTLSLPENSPAGTLVGTVTASDDDVGQTRQFSVTAGNIANAFAINLSTGAITISNAAAINFETNPVFNLTVSATDNGSPPATGTTTIKINLTNVNEPPVIPAQSFTLVENSPNGTSVGQVVVLDEDVGQSQTFSIIDGNYFNAFAIDPVTGLLTVNNATGVDYEAAPTFLLTISVKDSGSPALSATGLVTVNLTNVNDRPVLGPHAFAVVENSPAGTFVGKVTAVDQDPGQTLTYAITAGNTDAAFVIDPATGVITVNNAAPIDFERISQFNLTVTATDNGTPALSAAAPVSIQVYNVNETPVVSATTISLPENSPAGAIVGTVTASDSDLGQTRTFAIIGGNVNGAFQIDPGSGQLRVANPAALDFETTPRFGLTIAATDNGIPVLTGTGIITVNLLNVNEASRLTPQNFAVNENSPVGTVVGTVTAADPDAGQSLKYAIVSGNLENVIAIDPATGVLTVSNPSLLNFEITPVINLVVSVTDNGVPALSASTSVTVAVNNVNELPVIGPQSLSVLENSPVGTGVGVVSATDPDLGQTLVFSILGGNPGGAFAISPTTGLITVAKPSAIDYETTPSFTLNVAVTDSLGGQSSAPITIAVNDLNDPPVVPPQSFTLPENSPAGALVGTVQATDQDLGQTRSFVITSGNIGSAFRINNSTGEIAVQTPSALNFETTPQFVLTVMATDNGLPAASGSGQVTINLSNVNEAPTMGSQSFTIAEHGAVGTLVGTLVASDPDVGQLLTYAIVSGNTGNAFAVDPATGKVTIANPSIVDFATNPSFSLGVSATDPFGLKAQATTFVTVLNINDPPVVVPATFTLAENSAAGNVVGTVTATDLDQGQTSTFAITAGNDGNAFAINPTTGQITVQSPAALDFETKPTFTLTVRATDNGSPPASGTGTVTINLTNVNEAPVVPAQQLSVKTGSQAGKVVGTVMANDPEHQPVTFAITAGNGALNNNFAINATTGVITVRSSNAVRTATTYNLTVRATDNGNPALSGSGNVKIVVSATGPVAAVADLNAGAAQAVNTGARTTTPAVANTVSAATTTPATTTTASSSGATADAVTAPAVSTTKSKATARSLADLLKKRSR